MDPEQDKEAEPTTPRKTRLEELLLLIAGLEVSIRQAIEDRDWDFVKVLRDKQQGYYYKLRRVSYGLAEERTPRSAQES